eukprot:6012184-Pyramimonas_sp.AAC.1
MSNVSCAVLLSDLLQKAQRCGFIGCMRKSDMCYDNACRVAVRKTFGCETRSISFLESWDLSHCVTGGAAPVQPKRNFEEDNEDELGLRLKRAQLENLGSNPTNAAALLGRRCEVCQKRQTNMLVLPLDSYKSRG